MLRAARSHNWIVDRSLNQVGCQAASLWFLIFLAPSRGFVPVLRSGQTGVDAGLAALIRRRGFSKLRNPHLGQAAGSEGRHNIAVIALEDELLHLGRIEQGTKFQYGRGVRLVPTHVQVVGIG